ncbi:hypothetical protein BC939DRAFT_387797, partial [Gamsiella multidivaricata]|uniref:uncharacterized protein n=1 Tax=Gamsiella multidivaricata TaxID=101098 RepID=UPI00221EC255
SPKNPKNAKSLTIFAPSYSDSTLSIHSAPLQPSQSHQAMSMGPLPSPSMYPPSTPFLSNPKHMFIETVSNLFDSVDSSRSLKYTLEEQVRKSAQLLQTLQASGTMIENLVRGQFKELEKGVIERFESEIEHLSARVRQLEEHQGLTPPPKKAKATATSSQ